MCFLLYMGTCGKAKMEESELLGALMSSLEHLSTLLFRLLRSEGIWHTFFVRKAHLWQSKLTHPK